MRRRPLLSVPSLNHHTNESLTTLNLLFALVWSIAVLLVDSRYSCLPEINLISLGVGRIIVLVMMRTSVGIVAVTKMNKGVIKD